MCRAAVSQFASDINDTFDNPNRGELLNKNDNGVPYTSILLNNAVASFNDSALISNAQNNNLGGPYQTVGFDANPDRSTRELFGFNFFRLGTMSTNPFPSPNDQRRIMIINGTTREILFSFTPTGSSAQVRNAVAAQRQIMLDAINSVTPVVEEINFEITSVSRASNELLVSFNSLEGLDSFRIMGTLDLQDFDIDLTAMTTVNEIQPGAYLATVNTSGMGDRLFLRIEHDE